MANIERVIATNDHLQLISVGNGDGYVLNTYNGKRSEVHSVASILAKGDWEPVEDKVKA